MRSVLPSMGVSTLQWIGMEVIEQHLQCIPLQLPDRHPDFVKLSSGNSAKHHGLTATFSKTLHNHQPTTTSHCPYKIQRREVPWVPERDHGQRSESNVGPKLPGFIFHVSISLKWDDSLEGEEVFGITIIMLAFPLFIFVHSNRNLTLFIVATVKIKQPWYILVHMARKN